VYVDHSVGGVPEEIQDDLLELNPIAGDGWEIIGKLRLKNDAISLKVVRREGDYLSRDLVQIQRLERELPLAEHSTEARDYLRGASAVPDGSPGSFQRAVDVRRIG
jgi:hypothetical protein